MRRLINRLPPIRGRTNPVLAIVFLLVCTPVLVLFALAVPTGEVPDEVAHIVRADSVRHAQLVGVRWWRLDAQGARVPDAAVWADPGLVAPGFAFTPGVPLVQKQVTQGRLDELRAMPWANRLERVSVTNTAVYPPTLYGPAALAMHVAKRLGALPYDSILAARLMNALVFLALGATALLTALRGRTILFAILGLPMTLSLAASVNQDGLVIACAGLAAALLTRRTPRAWWIGTGLFAVAAMAKPFLVPLALVVLATAPGSLRRNWGRALAGVAVAVGPAMLWAAAMAAFVAAPFVRGPAQAGGPLYTGPAATLFATTNPGEQLHILLAVPSRLVTLPLLSIWDKGAWFWREAIGVLGALDVVLPFPLYDAWLWALAAALLAGFMAYPFHRGNAPFTPALPPLLAATLGLVGAIWMAYVLQYLSWTRVGDALIDGFQGRYVLPALAIALPVAAFMEDERRDGTTLRAALSIPVLLVAAVDMVLLPTLALGAYYIR